MGYPATAPIALAGGVCKLSVVPSVYPDASGRKTRHVSNVHK